MQEFTSFLLEWQNDYKGINHIYLPWADILFSSPITSVTKYIGKEIYFFQSFSHMYNPFKSLVKGNRNETRDKDKSTSTCS